jgi:hypothetical protein
MKFVSDHPKTKEALRAWAGGEALHTASFYFWNQGFELQKSQKGLLRTLLFQILSKTPDAVHRVLPRRAGQGLGY